MKSPKNKLTKTLGAVFALTVLSSSAYAQKVTVTVLNLTHGSHFTPLLVAAHDNATHLFQSGSAASAHLQAMAEGGDTSALIMDLDAAGALHDSAAGLLAPGHSFTSVEINTDGTSNNYLSIVGMVLPSNDGFVGVNSWHIPSAPGTYMMPALAYDAGTEANDELLGLDSPGAPGNPGLPAAPSGRGGLGGTGAAGVDTNQSVHIHRGILGDTNAEGGSSDLDSRVHRWLNPVARVIVTVSE
ncbi:MAG: spondin domain-containing protein [Cocleimonas sp.]